MGQVGGCNETMLIAPRASSGAGIRRRAGLLSRAAGEQSRSLGTGVKERESQ